MADAIKANRAGLAATFSAQSSLRLGSASISGSGSVIGYMQGINLGGPISRLGDGFGRHMQTGVVKNSIDGNPTSPCLELQYPGMWRFRWVVKSGLRTIAIDAKQVANVTPYPSMIVKANPAIGLSTDILTYSSGGVGWSTIGPVSHTFSAVGVVWVELWNNCVSTPFSAFFDHLVAT